MKRNEHIFQFTGKAISAAALSEHQYHTERAGWWETAQAEAIAAARAAGIEVREYPVTGGNRAEVVIDPTVSARVQETYNKLVSHLRAADRFKIEADAYGTQADRVFDLHPDDIMYFRLAGGPREE